MNFHHCAGCGHVVEVGAGFCERCGQPSRAAVWGQPPAFNTAAGGYAWGAAAPVPFAPPVRPFRTVGDALLPTFRLYREQFIPVGKIVLAVTFPLVAVQYVATQMAAGLRGEGLFIGAALASLLSVVVSMLMTGALIHNVTALLWTGASPTVAESYTQGLKVWWKVLLCWVLGGILSALGALLFIVPGVILWVACSVALPAVVVEGRGPIRALERSIDLTSGYRWRLFGAMVLLWLVMAGVTYLTTGFDEPGFEAGGSFLVALTTSALQHMMEASFTVLSVFAYFGIRADRGELAPGFPPAAPTP